jgi:hypothetical protein
MPNNKKATAKSRPVKARASGTKTKAAAAPRVKSKTTQQLLAENRMHIQLLTICFTILCVVFAIEAYWQYCR